jgi:N-carbamoylputrescine amidase
MMKITVCELPNDPDDFTHAWERLVEHVGERRSDLVLLPEMPFYRWLSQTKKVNPAEWELAVRAHDQWIGKLDQLAPATVVSSRPVVDGDRRHNVGFVWEPGTGALDIHAKHYLPDEPGFWEATWYQRGDGDFSIAHTSKAKIGFLICTEVWFMQHAREYGKRGAHIIVCPRATPRSTAPKWLAGAQAAAVVSGAFCLSSNLAGTTTLGGDFAGVGWIVEPEEGMILGTTSANQPFLTLDVDLDEADRAKKTYPRYVEE